MADEIKQVFGLDAKQALQALSQLDSGFQKLSKTLADTGDAARRFNGTSSQVSADARKIGSAFESSMGKASQATERLTVSWGLMARIVTTQAIVRALSQLRSTAQDTVNQAIEFQTKLAEIQTIEPGSGLATLSDHVRQLSDSFNIPLLDVAAAKYEAISNGFTSAADQSDVLTASFKFSKVAQTEAGKSLDLLSSVINAYGLKAANAEAISGKLFRTIEIGKVTGTELANSLGRVNSIAAQTGVSLDEVLAQFASLTISGVNASEAATQISATLSAMVKPSDAAAEAFKQLGFSSFETAQQTLGLQGTIKGLISTTDGSAAAIAKIFPNIRALRDVLSVVPNDARLLDFLKQIQGIDTKSFNAIVDKSIATDAQRVTAELTKLKNFLTVDLGQSLLSTAGGFARLTGGIDNVTGATSALSPVLITGTALLAAYAAAAYKGATANAAFASAFKGGAAGLLLGAGAAAGGNLIGDKLVDAIEGPGKAFQAAELKRLTEFRKSQAELLSTQEQSDEQRLEATLRTVAQLNQAYLSDAENTEAAAKLLVANANRTADAIVASREKLAASFDQSARESQDIARDSQGRIADLAQRTDNRQFDQRTSGLDDAQKAFALTSRASELADKAAKALAQAAATGDKSAIAQATRLFDEAQRAGETAQDIGARAGNRALEARAAKALDQVTNRQLTAEKQLLSVQKQRESALDALAKKQLATLDSVRQQADIIKRNSNFLDESGKLLPEGEIKKRQQAAAAATAKLRQSGLSDSDVAQADRLGVGRQARDFNVKLAQQSTELSFNATAGIAKVQSDLQASFNQFKIKLGFDVGGLESALGKTFSNPEEVARGIEELKTKAAELRAGLSQATGDNQNLERLKTELAGISAALDSADRAALRFVGLVGSTTEQRNQVAQLRQELDLLARSGNLSDEQLQKFFQDVAKLGDEAISGNVAKNVGLGLDFNELARGVGLLKELQASQRAIANNPALDAGASQLQTLEGLIQRLAPPDFSPLAQQAVSTAGAFQSASSALAAGVGLSQSIADNMVRAAVAAGQVQFEQQSVDKKAAGGIVKQLASGGPAGTDTVPAMLTPGEFVVNTASSRTFFSELQAINSGIPPAPRSSTTNAGIIGDVSVSVTAGAGGRTVGREVVQAINREIRRGTSKLR